MTVWRCLQYKYKKRELRSNVYLKSLKTNKTLLSFDKSYRKRSCIPFDTNICDALLTWTTHLTGVYNCNRQWSWKTLAHPGLNMKFNKRTQRPLHALTRPGAMRDSKFWTQYSAAQKTLTHSQQHSVLNKSSAKGTKGQCVYLTPWRALMHAYALRDSTFWSNARTCDLTLITAAVHF